ncbi:MAG: T9SS type A sorting domain-containing protein [bacterium]
MKLQIKFTILFFIICSAAINKINAQWFQTSQFPGLILLQVSVADSNVVWITGILGTSTNLRIYRSIDGGNNWDSIPRFPSSYPVNVPILSAIDSSTAFCVFAKADPYFRGSAFYKTTNSGREWILIDSITSHYWDIGFSKAVPYIGMVLASIDETVIYKTFDKGNSWSINILNTRSPARENSFCVINEAYYGYVYSFNHAWDLGVIMTQNGGNNWYNSHDQTGLGTGLALSNDKINGIMTCSNTEDNIFKTTNGGLNWSVLDIGIPLAPAFWNPTWIYGTSTVFLTSTLGVIRSDNNGANFVMQNLPAGVTLRKEIDYCKYENKIIAYGVCQNGIIIKSRQEIIRTNLQQTNTNVPSEYVLFQNYPNPFNPVTKIKFSVPENQFIKIQVYDIQGKEIQQLLNERVQAGNYETKFNGNNFSSGIYYYTLESDNFSITKKMLLIK